MFFRPLDSWKGAKRPVLPLTGSYRQNFVDSFVRMLFCSKLLRFCRHFVNVTLRQESDSMFFLFCVVSRMPMRGMSGTNWLSTNEQGNGQTSFHISWFLNGLLFLSTFKNFRFYWENFTLVFNVTQCSPLLEAFRIWSMYTFTYIHRRLPSHSMSSKFFTQERCPKGKQQESKIQLSPHEKSHLQPSK